MYYYINNITVINSQLLRNYYKFKSIDFFINQNKVSIVFNLQSYRNFPCVSTVFGSGFCFITKHVKLRRVSFCNTKQNMFFIEKEEAHFYDKKQIAR